MSRRRWVYTEGGKPLPEPVEVTQDWRDPGIAAPLRSDAEVYGSVTPSTDGTDISSRTKHRAYMQRNGLALASDYTEAHAKAREERAKALSGDSDTRARREDVARALYTNTRGRK